MKKNLSSLVIAICAIVMFALPVYAGYIESIVVDPTAVDGSDLDGADAGADDVVIALEKIPTTGTGYTLVMDGSNHATNAAGIMRTLIYTPTTDLASGSQIWMKLTNATWDNGSDKLYLVGVDAEDDAILYGTEDGKVDTTGAADDTYVKFVLGADLSSGTDVYILRATSAPLDDDMADSTFATDNAAGVTNLDAPTIVIDSGLAAGATVTLQVEKSSFAGGDIVGGRAAAEIIVTIEKQLAAAIENIGATTGPATSVIDVATDRLNFANEGAGTLAAALQVGGSDTYLTLSAVEFQFDNDSDSSVDDFVIVDADDELAFTLSGLTSGVSSVSLNTDDSATVDADEAFTAGTDQYTSTITLDATGADNVKNIAVAHGAVQNFSLAIAVDDATILTTRTYTVAVALDFNDADLRDDATFIPAGTSSHVWTINGAQFFAPHVVSRGTYDSYLIVKSASGSDVATVTLDLLNRDGETAQIVKTLEASSTGGSLFISASDLLADPACAAWTATGVNTDFSVFMTITLQEANVFVEGFKYNSGSTDMNVMTVYEGTAQRASFVK